MKQAKKKEKKSLKIPKETTIEEQTIQWPKEKQANNNIQNTTQKTKDWATRTILKT